VDDETLTEIAAAMDDVVVASGGRLTADALVEFGWPELYDDEPSAAVGTLFGALGRHAARSPALEFLVVAELARHDIDAGAGGQVAVAFREASAGHGPESWITLSPNDEVARVIVVHPGHTPSVAVVAGDQTALSAVGGIDPRGGIRRITDIPPDAAIVPASVAEAVVASIRRAIAHEQLALAERMLSIAVDHASTREQFGSAIGTNQAVQHRLAEVHVALRAGQESLRVAWEIDDGMSALVSGALAASAAETAIRQAMQVCGGMGFTDEFSLAPFVRRSLVLSGAVESHDCLVREVGERVVGAGVRRLGDIG
jgi:hypothetical protein